MLKNDGATRPGEAVMVGYREPSLGFYQGGTIREGQNNRPLQAVPPDQWPRWIVMSLDMWNRTPADIRGQWAELATLRGLNLAAGGQIAEVVVARRRE